MSIAISYSVGELKKPRVGVIAFAGSIGTIIEWYDFLIYGTASALVSTPYSFLKSIRKLGTLAALGTFAGSPSRVRKGFRRDVAGRIPGV